MQGSAQDAIAAFESIHRKLATLRPLSVTVTDDSHLHVGHKEAHQGAHLRLEVVSESFRGLSALQRHRAIYDALGPLPRLGIHALSINAQEPKPKE